MDKGNGTISNTITTDNARIIDAKIENYYDSHGIGTPPEISA